MHKIFNCVTGNYIKAFHLYELHPDGNLYDTQKAFLIGGFREYFSCMDNLKNAIANRQITDGRPRISIHEVVVIEDLTFPSFSSFYEFCQNWFTKKEGFVGYYKEGQFRDKFENYANR